MASENPTGADNQQGSRDGPHLGRSLTPQRLHAELLGAAGAKGLEAYLQGALRDATHSVTHRSHRFGQKNRAWLELLQEILMILGHRGWIYREGRQRDFWVLETTAPFLDMRYATSSLVGTVEGLHFVRGYFDAEGGMPRVANTRLYFQFCQKDRDDLSVVRSILESWGVACGRLHNPSRAVDPEYWRFYVRAEAHARFMNLVGSWHPRKREQMRTRMKI